MAYSAITTPEIYMAAYSTIPLRVIDDAVANVEGYKYLVNIVYNEKTILNASTASYEGNLFTLITYSTPHVYKRGDELLLLQASGLYDGYYTIMSVPTDSSIIINLELGQGLTGTTTTSNHIPYNISASPTEDIKEDLSDTLKNFVTQNLSIDSEIFEAPDTRFDYGIKLGYEGKALYTFDDNVAVSGNTGFLNTGLTATTQVDFQIGDQIIIDQDLYEWNYTDNFFSSGNLGFTGSTNHAFFVGNTITVSGQITEPYYNGETVVTASASTKSIRTAKGFISSTPVEGGTIFGVITPEYNTTAVITNIYYDAGLGGVIIVTDIGFARATPPIGGRIKHSDGKKIRRYNVQTISNKTIYNAAFDKEEYSVNAMSPYVIKAGPANQNNFSTLLSMKNTYRIEPSTLSYLLVHNYTNIAGGALYRFYDVNDVMLAESYLPNNTTNLRDYYVPIGLEALSDSSLEDLTGSFASAYDFIDHYEVYSCTSAHTINSRALRFEVNNDCSQYEMYHMFWKDKRGSWLSYPFKYMATDSLSVERKKYYKTSGNWANNTFTYDIYDRGETSFMVRGREKITINSGWIEEFENELIKDMFLSAQVYIQTPDNELKACMITSDSLVFGSENNVQMWQYQLEVQLSNNIIRL